MPSHIELQEIPTSNLLIELKRRNKIIFDFVWDLKYGKDKRRKENRGK